MENTTLLLQGGDYKAADNHSTIIVYAYAYSQQQIFVWMCLHEEPKPLFCCIHGAVAVTGTLSNAAAQCVLIIWISIAIHVDTYILHSTLVYNNACISWARVGYICISIQTTIVLLYNFRIIINLHIYTIFTRMHSRSAYSQWLPVAAGVSIDINGQCQLTQRQA